MADDEMLFAVPVEKDGNPAPVYLHGLTLTRLYEDIVVPYEQDKPFIVDGVQMKRGDLKRLKSFDRTPAFP